MNSNLKYLAAVAATQVITLVHLIRLFGQRTFREFCITVGFSAERADVFQDYLLYKLAVELKEAIEWLSVAIGLLYAVIWTFAGYFGGLGERGKWLFNIFSPRCAFFFLLAKPVVYLLFEPRLLVVMTFLLVNLFNYKINVGEAQ